MLNTIPDLLNNIVEKNVFCQLPFNKLILNSWGQVSMCCHQLTQLGTLDENTSVLDIWNSDLAKSIRKETDEGNLHRVCTSWDSCPFILKGRTKYNQHIFKNSAYPTYLEICLPDKHCNVGGENPSEKNPACIMCRRNFAKPQQEDLTEFLCEKAKPLIPYLLQLCVLGIAEPFWKDAVFKIFDMLDFQRYKHQIEFTTNTNGICLNQKTIDKFFLNTTKSDIAFSLDSASPETHITIRRLDAFDIVVKNLKNWIETRKQFGGSKFHKVCIYNNINMFNVFEMTKMVEMASDLQVDKMIMLPTYDQAGTIKLPGILMDKKNVHIFKKQSELAMERSKELGVKLHYSKVFDVPELNIVQLNII